ncbi:hypothetical protein [Allorhizocola rhizosphaerae]|uniref:hypothetical protein n=1 Tax=Allorhizocola rhizosphaerae TaxID=1872709 RepID=UPI0013C361D4|nr:hypothetical protein [Allorhizocola rhizosphaerae]
MLVRLATAWIDPAGGVHGAGEHIDVDAITLAELEEQGIVETMTEPTKEKDPYQGPTGVEPQTSDYQGPTGSEPDDDGDYQGPTDDTTGGGGN